MTPAYAMKRQISENINSSDVYNCNFLPQPPSSEWVGASVSPSFSLVIQVLSNKDNDQSWGNELKSKP